MLARKIHKYNKLTFPYLSIRKYTYQEILKNGKKYSKITQRFHAPSFFSTNRFCIDLPLFALCDCGIFLTIKRFFSRCCYYLHGIYFLVGELCVKCQHFRARVKHFSHRITKKYMSIYFFFHRVVGCIFYVCVVNKKKKKLYIQNHEE